ncbi:MAG: 30S ribosomal protein S20 [Clostridia bacterium]|nr:30S ribosomal protein S20 [Clostridia bacterium]
MPNIKSAKKRVIVTELKNAQNRSALAEIKTSVRKLNAAIESGDKAQAQQIFRETSKLLDEAVSAGRIHINKAANRKSGFAKRINAMA